MSAVVVPELLPSGLRRLLWMRSIAKLSRLKRRFMAPKRLALTMLAVLLGFFWLGQALAAIFLRPPADPDRLRTWITGGLVLYAYWHLLRSVWAKDLEGIKWSDSERELLWTAPVSDRQLVAYRFAGMIGPAMLKAGLLTLVLLPDSARPELTFLGLCLALGVLELLRMAIETSCWGLSIKASQSLRIGVTSIAVAFAASIGIRVWRDWSGTEFGMPMLELPNLILGGLVQLGDTDLARILGTPLGYIADVATSSAWNTQAIIGISVGLVEVVGLALLVFWLQRIFTSLRVTEEQQRYSTLLQSGSLKELRQEQDRSRFDNRDRLPAIRSWQGLGSLIGRHSVTLQRYWFVASVTLFFPAALSLFPVFVLPDDQPVMLHVVGSLVFYTLLLGPPALKIDFRRDLDRMLLLSQLPISPMRVVVGQMALPVLACLVFQFPVLVISAVACSVSPVNVVVSMAVLVPATVFIFALENAIFLAFPQRIGQEGIEVLVRTTLVFTFKGLLFGIGVAVMFAWSLATKQLPLELQPIIYRIGGLAMVWALALATLYVTAIGFRRFDLSIDVPAE